MTSFEFGAAPAPAAPLDDWQELFTPAAPADPVDDPPPCAADCCVPTSEVGGLL